MTLNREVLDLVAEQNKTYEEFWKDIICDESGNIDLAKLKVELHDYYIICGEVSKAYCHLTNGKISKPNANADYVIQFAEEYYASMYGSDSDSD